MDQFLYLILTLCFLLLWGMVWYLRPDLRHRMLRPSIIGAIAGALAEFWYFQDYWQPPTLTGIATLSPEDFLIGFALAGLGVAIPDVALRTRDVPGAIAHRGIFFLLFFLGLASLLIWSTWLSYNSVIVSEIAFALCAAVMLLLRPDLWKAALISGVLLGTIGFVLYFLLFTWMAPHYWQQHWLLAKHPLFGGTLLRVPLTEIAWYTSWGILAAVIPGFVQGTVKRGTTSLA